MIPHSKPTLTDRDFHCVDMTLKSNMISSGKKVQEFEREFKRYIQKEYIQLYSSGTQALYSLFLALNIKLNDEIVMPSYICHSVKEAILKIGAIPIYYDNEKDSWISSYKQIFKAVTNKTKAIIVNHTFGIQYDYAEIKQLQLQLQLQLLNIHLIEDCAHFISSKKSDVKISNLFIASFYSFNATKLLAMGEGGAVCTNDKNLSIELNDFKLDYGISDINASLGLSQLEQLDDFLNKRIEVANCYFENFQLEKKYQSIYFRFTITSKNLNKFLISNKVAYRKGVDAILYDFKNCKDILNKTVSIPIYPSLSKNEIDIILDETKKLLDEN